jgi:class 3 adenylate cyclase/tetratricopeptide (TPR) repeat protein
MAVCGNCGQANPEIARFCLACGAALVPEAPSHETRRTVTVVFSDVVGSTAFGERLDSESLREVMSAYFDAMRQVVERHGGTVEKYIGDAVMAVFGVPQAHEDDALRAVRAALEMASAPARLSDDLAARWGVTLTNRTGVNTGEVTAGDAAAGQRLITGDVVNVAARLEQAAPAGGVLIGESTYRLVRDAVSAVPVAPLALKGKAELVPAYRLRGVVAAAEAVPRRHDVALVGRDAELAVLDEALATVARDRCCRMVTVLGEAGVGKSRLLAEFASRAGEGTRVFPGRCLPYGESLALRPMAEVLQAAAGIHSRDDPETTASKLTASLGGVVDGAALAARLGVLVGESEETFPVEELFWAARRFLEHLGRTGPIALIVDDLHWAEPTLLALIEHIAVHASDAPLLLVCASRPELREARPDWPSDVAARVVEVQPLSAELVHDLVEGLLADGVAEDVLAAVARAAEGNPLFAEQFVAMLLDDRVLEREDGIWRASTALVSLSVPPGIAALLSARLDRLPAASRAVLERAAVIGQSLDAPAVAELSPDVLKPAGPTHLETLVARDFLVPGSSPFAPGRGYGFRHALIREVTYGGILKRSRAQLHERFGRWLEESSGSRTGELEVVIATHFEQASRYLQELGADDDRRRALAQLASERLASAGRRAMVLGDPGAAAELLRRAESLWQGDATARVLLQLHLVDALEEIGSYDEARRVISAGEQLADTAGNAPVVSTVRASRIRFEIGLGRDLRDIDGQELDRLQSILEAARDHRGLADLWWIRRSLTWMRLHIEPSVHALRQVLHHAELLDDQRQVAHAIDQLAACAIYGPMRVDEGLALCRGFLDRLADNRRVQAGVRMSLGVLLAMKGSFDEARALCDESIAMMEDLGLSATAAAFVLGAAETELLAGHPRGAERRLKPYLAFLIERNDRWALPTEAAIMARALLAQGRIEEAEHYVNLTWELADADDLDAQARWRLISALILARRGQFAHARRLSSEGVRLTEGTDSIDLRATLLLDEARVLRIAGDDRAAEQSAFEALSLYQRKENVVGAGRAQDFLDEAERVP